MVEDSLFRVLFDNMTSGAAIYEVRNDGLLGRDYIIRDFNKKSCEIENVKREDVIGKSLYDLRPTIDDYGLIDIFRQVWETGEPAFFPSKQYVDEKYSDWYENQVFKLPTGEIVATYNDVTERELRAIETREVNDMLSSLIDNAPYGIFIVDEKGRYRKVNKAACIQTGYTHDDFRDLCIKDFETDITGDEITTDFTDLKQNGAINVKKEYCTKSGEKRMWELSAVKINDYTFIAFTKDITEEEKMKNRVLETSDEYQALFDNAALGIGYFSTDGQVIWFNKLAARNMGGEPDEFKGKTFMDIFPEDAAKEYMKRLRTTIESNSSTSYEDELTLPIGTVTFYSAYNCIHDKKGNLKGVQIISQDITELKNAEKAIAQSQREYKILFDEAPLGYQSLDENGNFLAVNGIWLEMLGYPENEVIGHNFSEFIHPDYIPLFHENFPKFKKDGSTCVIFIMKKKNGEFITVKFDGKIVRGENDEFIKTQCMLQDVTQAQAMEEKLKESESKFRDMFEEAPMGYHLLDESGTVIDVNKAWLEILGLKKDMVIGTSMFNLVSDEYHEMFRDYREKLKDKGRNTIELEMINKKGTTSFVKIYGRAISDSKSGLYRSLGLVQDITALKKLEQVNINMEAQLRNQKKLESIGVLAGGVAHEINNPINGIMNYGQLILDELGEDSECSEYAREIIHESQRISLIVRDLLQFSRQKNQSFQQADIKDIITHTDTLIRTIMMHDQIELTIDVERNLPGILCRSGEIQQVLMNLLTNARDALNDKYKGYDSSKTIRLVCKKITRSDGAWIQISIRDNGVGISEDLKDSIFDPFFTTKGRDEGTGLGLSISYGIIKDHGGNLYYESEVGYYTTFYIELPVD
ncbi:MAG TPA: PAS domain S-box protein [Clostridia bacterium]|nr:PAS domain S-box protein [Clostridia bacterium]HPQ47742.1 PAS domain S-box protein [Clostridia bacterium]